MKDKLLLVFCVMSLQLFAQNDTTVDISKDLEAKKTWNNQDELKIFYGQRLINANTVEMLHKGVMEFRVIHNFEDIAGDNGGIKQFYGLDNAADIKISFQLGLSDKLNIVGARTRGDQGSAGDDQIRVGPVQQLWELGFKYQFLKQVEHDSKHGFSLTGYANVVLSTMDSIGGSYKESSFEDASERFSEVVQLMIAKRFGNVSLQLSPTYVYTNYVVPGPDDRNLFALGAGVRLPLSKKIFIIADYFHTFRTKESVDYLKSHNIHLYDALGVGIEIVTQGHVFHMNFTNARSILENRFIPRTYSSWGDGQYRWGFTIARDFQVFRDKKNK